MTNPSNLYQGISKCAWGYLFLYFDIKLGTVSILPDFMAFLFFLAAIELLKEEERELALLTPLGWILAVWNSVYWVLNWFAVDLDGLIPVAEIIVCLCNLYFQFQLLTNLSSIAVKYQPVGALHDEKLLKYRTMQTVLFTVMMVLSQFSSVFGTFWANASLAMAVPYLIAGLCMMSALFALRKDLSFQAI